MTFTLTRRAMAGRMVLAAMLPAIAASPLTAAATPAIPKPATEELATAALLHTAFPHSRLDAAFYSGIAARYLAEIAADPAAIAEHRRGLALLDESYIAPFAQLPEVVRRSMVAKYDQEPFFKALTWRGAELIYRDAGVWQMVGYEGSSVEYGGYIERGFDDIDWLHAGGGAK